MCYFDNTFWPKKMSKISPNTSDKWQILSSWATNWELPGQLRIYFFTMRVNIQITLDLSLFGIFISPLTIFLGSYWVFIPLLWKEIHSELRTQIEHLADVNLSLKWNKLERWSTQFLLGRSMDHWFYRIFSTVYLIWVEYKQKKSSERKKGRYKLHIKIFRPET